MHASPPDTTENVLPNAAATEPASRSPIRGPPVTTAIWSPASRPRSESGTASWMIVLRKTAEITSAHPAAASSSRAAGSQRTRPNPVMAAPHAMTATITARPWRWIRLTHPVVSAPARAPAPGAAYR
ncbi:MAG TPA: hypothetical protein VFV73_07800 [Streptosporangiaceae bacterium]|nr:hypothetical protein [Streptosporangiaceae bacterium]